MLAHFQLYVLVTVAAVYHSMWLSQQEKALKAGKITGRWTNRVISRLVDR